jgi:hypothetical protein
VVLFWADQLPPAKMRGACSKRWRRYQAFALALSDVSRDQALAQSLRVRIATFASFRTAIGRSDGRRKATRAARDARSIDDERELLREELDGVLASGDYPAALAMLKRRSPQNPTIRRSNSSTPTCWCAVGSGSGAHHARHRAGRN